MDLPKYVRVQNIPYGKNQLIFIYVTITYQDSKGSFGQKRVFVEAQAASKSSATVQLY